MLQGYEDPSLAVDLVQKKVTISLHTVSLTRKEYELLAILVRNAGEIVPRDSLLMLVWGYGKDIRTRTLDVHIRRLRKKLSPASDRYIETIFGIGYRFQPYRAVVPVGFSPVLAIPA